MTKTKNIIIILFALFCWNNLSAQIQLKVIPQKATVDLDKTVDVDVTVTNAASLFGAAVNIVFDAAKVQYVSFSNSGLLSGFEQVQLVGNTVKVNLTNSGLDEYTGDGVLFTLTFKGIGEGKADFTYSDNRLRNSENTALPVVTTPGSVTVTNPVPVELTEFSGKYVNGEVVLNWKTATEINSYGFDVERNGEKIGFVAGAGNSNSPKSYTFIDKEAPAGNVNYRLKQIDIDGQFKYYDAITINVNAPKEFKLMQNSPNPFNPSTAIKFQMPSDGLVTIKIYDQIGREVTTLLNETRSAGSHIVYWNGRDMNGMTVSSGIYLYRLSSGSFSETKKMNFMK